MFEALVVKKVNPCNSIIVQLSFTHYTLS